MTTWVAVSQFPLNEDLHQLNQLLQVQGYTHRFTEEQGVQILWVLGTGPAQQLQQQFAQNATWYQHIDSVKLSNKLAGDITAPGSMADQRGRALVAFLHYPVTLIIILGGIIGALLIQFDTHFQWIPSFTLQNFVLQGSNIGFYSLNDAIKAGEWWRLITPIFLHFGLLHVVFNALWIWEFGRRIEPALGSKFYLSLILMVAVSSNLLQYVWQGPSLFGGLSGVVYGLLGFIWVRQYRYPDTITPVPPALIGFMLFWLVLGMTGVIDVFMSGKIANAAHLVGLISGMIVGITPIKIQPKNL